LRDHRPPLVHFKKGFRSGSCSLCSKVSKNREVGLPLPRLPAPTRFLSLSRMNSLAKVNQVSDRLPTPVSRPIFQDNTRRTGCQGVFFQSLAGAGNHDSAGRSCSRRLNPSRNRTSTVPSSPTSRTLPSPHSRCVIRSSSRNDLCAS
jgi:hypothetical protein